MRLSSSPQDVLPERNDIDHGARFWRGLAFTRIVWLAIAALCIGLFIASLPERLGELTRLVAVTPPPLLGTINFPPAVYLGSAFALELLGPMVFLTLALLIVWRRSDNPGAIHISALLIAFGAALPGTAYAIVSGSLIWRVSPGALQALGWIALLIFAYLFPDGQWAPRWSRFLVPIWALWTIGFFAFAERLIAGRPALIVLSYLI